MGMLLVPLALTKTTLGPNVWVRPDEDDVVEMFEVTVVEPRLSTMTLCFRGANSSPILGSISTMSIQLFK